MTQIIIYLTLCFILIPAFFIQMNTVSRDEIGVNLEYLLNMNAKETGEKAIFFPEWFFSCCLAIIINVALHFQFSIIGYLALSILLDNILALSLYYFLPTRHSKTTNQRNYSIRKWIILAIVSIIILSFILIKLALV